MALLSLSLGARRGKYGLVVVYNINGTFNREYKLTEQELAALQASANGIPRGCTKEEWESGRAVVCGKDFDVGDMRVADGRVRIKTGETTVNGRIVESWLLLDKGEWTGTPPVITVPSAVLLAAASKQTGLPVAAMRGEMLVTSINAGVMDVRVRA